MKWFLVCLLLGGCGAGVAQAPLVVTKTVVQKCQLPRELLNDPAPPEVPSVNTTGNVGKWIILLHADDLTKYEQLGEIGKLLALPNGSAGKKGVK